MGDKGVGGRGIVRLDFRNFLCGSCSGSIVVWVGDVVDVPMYWEDFGRIPPQGGPQTDGTATTEGTRWYVGLSPSGGDDGEGKIIGGGYLHLLPPEKSFTVYCDQAHY